MQSKNIILENYKNLLQDIDQKTGEVYKGAAEIPCKNKCYDCCKQLFPVSFAEAYYISEGLKTMPRALRREREKAAEKITKKIVATNPLQFEKKGVSKKSALDTQSEFAHALHEIKSDCPALDPLNPAGSCTVYEFRNHDCRTMGFSLDTANNTIVGCFRFESLRHLAPKLMNFNYKYSEKIALDQKLIAEVTGEVFTSNILYFTTMCGPLLKDYSAQNWIKFFEEKGVPAKSDSDLYWVVIDV